jgi:hypothetical protein
MSSSVLKQAIGKAAGRSADVKTVKAVYINLKVAQRFFEFKTAAADITGSWVVAAFDTNLRIGRDGIGRFAGALVVDDYYAGHD